MPCANAPVYHAEKKSMRIYVTSVIVDDQAKALAFYTDVLGFVLKHDVPMSKFSSSRTRFRRPRYFSVPSLRQAFR